MEDLGWDDPGSEASLIYVVGRVNQGIRRELGALLQVWGLSVQEYTSLSVLGSRPGLSNAQLARRALVTPQSMLEILARLEARGLIRRNVDSEHRRIRRAELTASGRRLLRTTAPRIDALQDRIFADVPPRQRRAVLAALMAAMNQLSSHSADSASRRPVARPSPTVPAAWE